MEVNLDGVSWTMDQASQIEYYEQQIRIHNLSLVAENQTIQAGGLIDPLGPLDFRLAVSQLDLRFLQPWLDPGLTLQGVLSGQLQLAGTAQSPVVFGTVKLERGNLMEFTFANAEARLEYADEMAELEVIIVQEANYRFEVEGQVPIKLALTEDEP